MAEKRLIDANALRAVLKNEECDCEVFPWAVDNAPTVDAVEVIRCNDCRWYEHDLGICNLLSESKGEPTAGYAVGMDPYDFCSQGEVRKV